MSAKTGIQWTDATWNPVVGCTKRSQGCKNCWAKALHDARHKALLAGKKMPAQYAEPFEVIQMLPERLDMPAHWRKPRRVFVNSVSDLFHEQVDFHFIDEVFQEMRTANWHTYQILTKRPERAVAWFEANRGAYPAWLEAWPRNVWMGVSVEDQVTADERIPHLLKLPAAVRFLSCEPLLGKVDLTKVHDKDNRVYFDVLDGQRFDYGSDGFGVAAPMAERIQWVILGGESGAQARPMHVGWARTLREQCAKNHVKFFFKQWGEWCDGSQVQIQEMTGKKIHRWEDGSCALWVGKERAGHLLDGREWRQAP